MQSRWPRHTFTRFNEESREPDQLLRSFYGSKVLGVGGGSGDHGLLLRDETFSIGVSNNIPISHSVHNVAIRTISQLSQNVLDAFKRDAKRPS